MKTASKRGVNVERRIAVSPIAIVEMRVDTDGGDGTELRQLVGHAAVFDKLSEEMFGFREKIAKGAFARAIKEKQDVIALREHDSSLVLGRSTSGTLVLEEDKIGLRATINPPDTELGRETIELISRGDLRHMSFGFMTRKDSFEVLEDGDIIRTLEDVDLFDVSVVGFPAYPDTDVGLNSMWTCDDTCPRSFVEWSGTHFIDQPVSPSTRMGLARIRHERLRLSGRKLLDTAR